MISLWKKRSAISRAALIGLGSFLFVYLLAHLGIGEVTSLLLRIGWRFVWITAAYASHQLIRAVAYRECIPAGTPTSYWKILRIRLSGEAIQFLTSTGPFLAEPAKAWLLREQGLNAPQAIAATVSEYLAYTFTSAVFAIAALCYLLSHFEISGVASIVAKIIIWAMGLFLFAAAYAIVSRFYLIGHLLKGIQRMPLIGKRLRFQEKDIRSTEDLLFVIFRDRPLHFLSILALELAAQALLVLELFILLRSAGKAYPVVDAYLIEGATKFIGLAFFFIPGQIGAAEGCYAVIFKALGLSASTGFALALARRLRSLLVSAAGLVLASFRTGSRAPR